MTKLNSEALMKIDELQDCHCSKNKRMFSDELLEFYKDIISNLEYKVELDGTCRGTIVISTKEFKDTVRIEVESDKARLIINEGKSAKALFKDTIEGDFAERINQEINKVERGCY